MSPNLALLIASLLGALGVSPPSPNSPVSLASLLPSREAHRATHFWFENRKEGLNLVLLDEDESVAPAAQAALSHLLRCYRTDRERLLHPRLVEIVARAAEAFGRDVVDVISGYRAPPFGSPHSRHFLGRAMDLRLPGVPARQLAAWLWRNFRGVGVGLYPSQNFVHIDVRDVDIRWVDHARHGESGHARYTGRARGEISLPADAPHLHYDQTLAADPATVATIGFRGGF